MSDLSLFNATTQTEGTLALAHEKILRFFRGAVFENITGDLNNIAAVATPVTVARENYGNKGRSSVQKIGDNWVVTFDTEAVRDDNGAIAQAWLIDLINIAKAKGSANLADFQLFDAKDEALGAIEGTFSVTVADFATGYADKGGYKFTLTSDGIVEDITSPIAGDGKPIVESASPATATGVTVGDVLVLKGYHFTGTTGITMDAQTVLEKNIIDDNTIAFLVPASVSGSAPIVVTNANGAGASFPFTAA